jgi:hypothetical protein
MKRRLSAVEQMIDANIVYMVRLEGRVERDRLSSALLRVQRRHPALRARICEDAKGLYYEEDCAPEVQLRIIPRLTEEHYRSECQAELVTAFAYEQAQLRAVWLESELEGDLLLTTSHRICDGMSMLIIVREVLRALQVTEDLIPYAPVTTLDIIGDYRPSQPWKKKLFAQTLNGLLRLIPDSRRAQENKEHHLEWLADEGFLNTLKFRCKSEGVSIHAALNVALAETLETILGKERLPEWIESPIDARRGRLTALKSDMVFFGGGSIKLRTGRSADIEFWERARTMNREINAQVEQEMMDIPGRYYFQQLLRPIRKAQVKTIVRLGDVLKLNGSWNRFALSNLGNVVLGEPEASFRVKDLRIYMHSFNVRLLCLITYTFDNEMRFCCLGDERCLSISQADGLKREFMNLLQRQIVNVNEDMKDFSHLLAGIAE